MSEQSLPAPEQQIRALLATGDLDAALELTLRSYGPELLGFLHAKLRDAESARDAFAWLAEALWKGLPGFRAESSIRSWAFAIARNVAARYVERVLRKRELAVPLSQVSQQSLLGVALPLSTSLDVRLERLRAQLSEDERTLLSLRIDKRMDWNEIALVMLYEGDLREPDTAEQAREAGRLRKRFQLLKEKLRKLALSV